MNNTDIAIITETWLNDNIPSSAIAIGQSINIFRKDRTTSNGGGALAYVHNSIPT